MFCSRHLRAIVKYRSGSLAASAATNASEREFRMSLAVRSVNGSNLFAVFGLSFLEVTVFSKIDSKTGSHAFNFFWWRGTRRRRSAAYTSYVSDLQRRATKPPGKRKVQESLFFIPILGGSDSPSSHPPACRSASLLNPWPAFCSCIRKSQCYH